MQNGKSPGSDGFTAEFYKAFWEEIGDDVVQSINYAFDKGELSIRQKRGIITLLPKKDKPTNILNNLRPITLLNTDYKIATKVIAKRLGEVLPDIICANQTGYVKKRCIGENVRLISDVIEYTKYKQLPGIAVFVDFKKAFDSLEWDYLNKVLDVFNFKDDLKRWVKVFYNDISSCVISDGFASPFFNLNRGVRQGCPLSGLLFVLGIELLNLAIQTNPNIKGISVGNTQIKITLYADDTTLFLKDRDSVQALLETLESFKKCSGLEVNKAKTEAMWLGLWAERKDTPFGFRWPKDSVYSLGIHFTKEKRISDALNFEKKLEDLQKILNSWKRRKLTLLGRINIAKSLGLSKLIYNASVLSLPEEFAKKVDKIVFDFVWEGKPHKIKKKTR